jgi:hypothetical protein
MTVMANTNGAEVAQTPSKEQDADGQAESTGEKGANGQQPDSTCNRRVIIWERRLTMCRHLPGQHQAAPRALRDANDGPHSTSQYTNMQLTVADLDGRAGAGPPPVHHRNAQHVPVLVLPPRAQRPAH